MMKAPGIFIVLEGGEGAGKSTVLAALAKLLREEGREVIETREPGGTPLGERIRALILDSRGVDDALTELLLFEAARAHLVSTVVRPGIERGATVLCDRFTASSIAYQGYGRGLGREVVERANGLAAGGLAPDLTLLLDLPVEEGLARRAGDAEANHFDRETIEFHRRVRRAFLDLAAESPASWAVIDASQPLERVVELAHEAVHTRIQSAP
jgi:dTMP kinase